MSMLFRNLHIKRKTGLIALLLIVASSIQGQNVYFDSTTTVINTTNAPVNGGDTIFLEGGHYEYLFIENIAGKQDTPVVITNYNGEVIIHNDHYFGISFQNCKHIHLMGQYNYGIRITKVSNGAGIGISNLSNFFEVEHVEVANTKLAGIMCKTEPGCDFTASRDSFLMEDIHIHDNFLHDIGKEGMYIGSTKYFGKIINCNGKDTLVLPHLLKDIKIHDNLIKRTGWDGLQVSSASFDCAVYDNHILYDSREEQNFQMSGIINGSGTDCDCYNNYIAFGKGIGIEFYGLGGQKIYNNIIIEAGKSYFPSDPQKQKHGIYIRHKAFSKPDSSFRIFNNTIIRPKSDGIHFHVNDTLSAGNRIQNNIIVDPGAYDYYENTSSFRKGEDAYIFLTDTALDVQSSNNLLTRKLSVPAFYDTTQYNYTLKPGSPAIDAGVNLTVDSILFDFYHNPRPVGNAFDIGAFEFDSLIQNNMEKKQNKVLIYPNPAGSHFYVKAPFEEFKLNIFSIQGKEIISSEHLQSGDQIFLSSISPGLYLIRIKDYLSGERHIRWISVR